MKCFITILLFFGFITANATTYFVSNAGDNGNDATKASPFATINKALSVVVSGDTIKLKAGDVFIEQIIVPVSHLTFDSFGTGNKPLVTGFQTQTGFTNVYGNVWQAPTGILHRAINTVTINGLFAYKARYPDSTFLSYQQALNSSIKTYFTGDSSYVGSEIVIRCKQWVINVSKVTAQHFDTISFSPNTMYDLIGQWGFFFQNRQDFINLPGEYSSDSSTGILSCYSVGTPSVQLSTLDTLVEVNHKDNVTFRNIVFTGANIYTLKLDTSHNFTLKNCTIDSAGNYGIYASKCRDTFIDSSVIQNCYNIGIVLGNEFTGVVGITLDTCKRPRVTNNIIRKIGTKEGMASAKIYGTSPDGETSHTAIWPAADSFYLRNNRIDSIGGYVVRWTGFRDTMMYNYITNWGLVKGDVGAFYSYLGSPLAHNRDSTTFIYRNILDNRFSTRSALQGMFQNAIAPAPGLYADNFTAGVLHKENTIIDCPIGGIYSLEASNNTYDGNTSIDSVVGSPLYIYVPGTGLKLRNNIYYQKSGDGFNYRTAIIPLIPDLNSDSNYHFQPAYVNKSSILYNGGGYTLSSFKSTYGFDLHSTDNLPTGSLSTTPLILINPTNATITIFLTPSYIDARGNYYLQNKIVLEPYTSVILFKIKPIWGTKTFYTIH